MMDAYELNVAMTLVYLPAGRALQCQALRHVNP